MDVEVDKKKGRNMRVEFGKFDETEMGISYGNAVNFATNIVDESDPDLDEPRIQQLLQTAEAMRKDHADEDWLHLTALIRDCHIFQEGQIHLLRPRSGAAGHRLEGVDCLSWRLAVETNNLQNWGSLPESCEEYIGHYMLGEQYRHDCELVADAAIKYVNSLKLAGDGKDIWIFDIDETTLSNMPYYARSDVLFGALPYNDTKFNEWVAEGKAPAVPGALRLYRTLLSLGFKIVFLSGTKEPFRKVRIANLKAVGYHTWTKLILKGDADKGLTALAYKSKKRTELVKAGYRILGNSGDQWSDILGKNSGNRTFKIPDPMYYIG